MIHYKQQQRYQHPNLRKSRKINHLVHIAMIQGVLNAQIAMLWDIT